MALNESGSNKENNNEKPVITPEQQDRNLQADKVLRSDSLADVYEMMKFENGETFDSRTKDETLSAILDGKSDFENNWQKEAFLKTFTSEEIEQAIRSRAKGSADELMRVFHVFQISDSFVDLKNNDPERYDAIRIGALNDIITGVRKDFGKSQNKMLMNGGGALRNEVFDLFMQNKNLGKANLMSDFEHRALIDKYKEDPIVLGLAGNNFRDTKEEYTEEAIRAKEQQDVEEQMLKVKSIMETSTKFKFSLD
jgi:hypothetical protein